MLLIAIIIAFGLGSLLLKKGTLLEGNTAAIEPANKTIKAMVDGKPVHSYIVDD